MLSRRSVVLGGLALSLGPARAWAQASSEESVAAVLRERVDVGRESLGLVAGLLDGDRRSVFAYGQSGSESNRALDVDTVFEIGSITKVFTALLFADMVGFTDLSESLEPEELAEVLNGYLREMTAAVLAHGGTLDNFIGDAVMAVFGAPQERPEAEQAWAAIQAAMEMRARCRQLGSSLRERGIPADPDIRVGLNTAHCTVGVFGSEVMRAYKAVGFAVNVAARLQTAPDPGSILCGFRTYALVKDRVRAEERGALPVKGALRPVEAWEIVGLADA